MSNWENREVAFFGKITAGITHELKNVLAIIKESAGLMEDIMSLSPEALISHQDKFQNSLNKINNQIKRGVELTDRLNKFAHSADEIIAEIDLHATIEQIVALSQRVARLKNIFLQTAPPEQPGRQVNLVSQPVRLQMALFTAIECCLNVMPAGGVIRIGLEKSTEKPAVRFLCEGDLPPISEFNANLSEFEKWPVLQKIVAALEGSAELNESAHGLLLSLPERVSA
jgi:signal transduction histidine kinase